MHFPGDTSKCLDKRIKNMCACIPTRMRTCMHATPPAPPYPTHTCLCARVRVCVHTGTQASMQAHTGSRSCMRTHRPPGGAPSLVEGLSGRGNPKRQPCRGPRLPLPHVWVCLCCCTESTRSRRGSPSGGTRVLTCLSMNAGIVVPRSGADVSGASSHHTKKCT